MSRGSLPPGAVKGINSPLISQEVYAEARQAFQLAAQVVQQWHNTEVEAPGGVGTVAFLQDRTPLSYVGFAFRPRAWAPEKSTLYVVLGGECKRPDKTYPVYVVLIPVSASSPTRWEPLRETCNRVITVSQPGEPDVMQIIQTALGT